MSKTIKVLVVDDDVMMSQTLVDILNVKGYQASSANSGPAALTEIEKAAWDCVLSDIKMPEMNGVELFRAIREEKPQISMVLMTAYAHEELIAEALAEGATAALYKPLNIPELLDLLSSLAA